MHWTVEWTLRGLLIGASILTDADRWPSMPFLVRAFLSSHYHYTGWRISIWLSTNRYFRPLAEFFINKSVRFALDMFQVFAAPISTIWELTGQVISIVCQFRGFLKALSRTTIPKTDAPTAPPIKRPPSTYQYWSITADREIRLLELSAGDKDAPLRGRIIHIPLDEAPPYVALSYCWKDDSVPDTYARLHISSLPEYLEITENLARALRAARDDKEPQLL